MNYRDLNPQLRAALSAHQRTADRQASRWIEREIVGLMTGRVPFGGTKPRITYTRRDKVATITHGVS